MLCSAALLKGEILHSTTLADLKVSFLALRRQVVAAGRGDAAAGGLRVALSLVAQGARPGSGASDVLPAEAAVWH